MVRVTQALPLWGRRPKAGGGSFGVVDPECGRLPITPPSAGCADTSPIGGGA